MENAGARVGSPEQISRSYGASIVLRRWAATWLDLILLYLFALMLLTLMGITEPHLFWPISIMFVFAYYIVFEGLKGWTIGKLLLGIRVVDESGKMPGIGKAVIRTLFRLVEVNPILIGGLPAGICVLVSKKRQRVGDILADAYVVKNSDLRRAGPAATPQ